MMVFLPRFQYFVDHLYEMCVDLFFEVYSCQIFDALRVKFRRYLADLWLEVRALSGCFSFRRRVKLKFNFKFIVCIVG